MTITVEVAAGQPRPRLDVYVTEQIKKVNRAFIDKLIDQGKVLVDGKKVKSGFKLSTGDTIDIDYDFVTDQQIPDIDVPVLYEDDDCVVLIKPKGLLSHSKGVFNPEPTVATFIQQKATQMSGDRAGIVHRLDRATSGVIIGAKTPEALAWLQKQFSQRKVKKTYYAVVKSGLEPQHATIEIPIARNPRNPKTFWVSNGGKPAITEYKVTESGNSYDLLELKPTSGRTHQLRVHLAYLKHPIVGDTVYEGEPAPRLMLHAQSLELTLPNKQRKIFTAPLPDEFHAILK